MYVVAVKHYLTLDGLKYFIDEWFPRVHEIMRQQDGYISFIHEKHKDHDDCVNVVVNFKDQATLEKWGYCPAHDALVDALDPFRSKNYWEYAVIDNALMGIDWQTVQAG